MPKNTETTETAAEKIQDIDVSQEMQDSFLEYAYSVIYARALPDARDGLKPVQRRILYQMSEMGLRPDRGHVKSARVVGEVMGKLHPHGDASIYDALVRLAQGWTLRVPLIDGHGNFGSLDDGPAAARYTEARLAKAAIMMTEGLDEDLVDFVPNYDNQLTQPDVLPAAYPNLLVNGASGIAVGMATNMAPHNVVEVIEGARYLLGNPDASVDDLMNFIPGPDLPGGARIVGLSGIKDAYHTGRGSFKTRATVRVENVTARKVGIIVTELPYLVGAEKVISKVKDGVTSKKLLGISDVTDLTDRTHGLRLVIEVKTGFNPDAVLEQLYRYTPLEESFTINNVALVNGQPQTLGLKELLTVYLEHRITVVTRRSVFRLAKRRERLHLLEGLLIAILDIDEVIQLIRASEDTETARAKLRDVFELSTRQAEYILELRLRRLTRYSRLELETERDTLLREIAELEELLADPQRVRQAVSDELAHAAELLNTPRRTVLLEASDSAPLVGKKNITLELPDVPCRVFLSTTGRVIRADLSPDELNSTDAPAQRAFRRMPHDALRCSVTTTSRAEIGAITTKGRLIVLPVLGLPAAPTHSVQLSAGVKIEEYVNLHHSEERIVALVSLTSSTPIALGTRAGVVKRIIPNEWPNKPDYDIITLKPGDAVVDAAPASDNNTLVFVTSDAQLLRYPATAVRPQGRPAGGMLGITLAPGAEVIHFAVVNEEEDTVVVTAAGSSETLPGIDHGSVKVSALADFPSKGRATGGVRAQRLTKGENSLRLAWVGPAPALAVNAEGKECALPEAREKRDASGVKLAEAIDSIGYSGS